jgi:GNAT superfamily N-acetyltransferase
VPAVRRAGPGDLAAVADTLARAFADAEFVRAAVPADGYERRVRELYALYARVAHEQGEVWVADDGVAAALWMPPGGGGEVDAATGARLAELYGERLERFQTAAAMAEARRPAEPHWYLAAMATAPERQGRGLGGAVLAPVLERCDAEGALALTDTSTPGNVGFYARRGFAVADEWDEPGGAPHVWLLARPPRAQA